MNAAVQQLRQIISMRETLPPRRLGEWRRAYDAALQAANAACRTEDDHAAVYFAMCEAGEPVTVADPMPPALRERAAEIYMRNLEVEIDRELFGEEEASDGETH